MNVNAFHQRRPVNIGIGLRWFIAISHGSWMVRPFSCGSPLRKSFSGIEPWGGADGDDGASGSHLLSKHT